MKFLLALSAMLLFYGTAASEEPTLEWTIRLMKREISRGTKDDYGHYIQHKKEFKEVVSITIYTEGYKAALAKTSNSTGACFFAVVPKNEDGDEFIQIMAGIQKKEWKIIAPSIIGGARPRSMIEKNYGKEMELGGSSHAKRDKNNPGRLLNIETQVWVLTVKKANGDIAKLAGDSMAITNPKDDDPLPAKDDQPEARKDKTNKGTKEKGKRNQLNR